MEQVTFGPTGMSVSPLCLGCMSFGSSDWRPWVMDRKEGLELVDRAWDLGINFFDTANMYSRGRSEEILGQALEGRREAAVVATKVFFPMREGDPNSGGLSRKAIEQELDASLDRLGMDAVDLYQIHRWDPATPIEQTLRALTDAVRRGKVRHIGASSMWAWQFMKSLATSDRLGLERFVSMQPHYNLTYREEEREMLPLCQEEGVAVMPWSPLARGYLTRPHGEFETTTRAASDTYTRRHPYDEGGGPTINERVQEVAADKDATMAQVALAWVLHKDPVTTPIVGTSSIEHLEEAVEALDLRLTDDDLAYLEAPYEPVRVSGHR